MSKRTVAARIRSYVALAMELLDVEIQQFQSHTGESYYTYHDFDDVMERRVDLVWDMAKPDTKAVRVLEGLGLNSQCPRHSSRILDLYR